MFGLGSCHSIAHRIISRPIDILRVCPGVSRCTRKYNLLQLYISIISSLFFYVLRLSSGLCCVLHYIIKYTTTINASTGTAAVSSCFGPFLDRFRTTSVSWCFRPVSGRFLSEAGPKHDGTEVGTGETKEVFRSKVFRNEKAEIFF